jgi:pentatricopeptide repeat protein
MTENVRVDFINEQDLHFLWAQFLEERLSKDGAVAKTRYFKYSDSVDLLFQRLTKQYMNGGSVPVSPAGALLVFAQIDARKEVSYRWRWFEGLLKATIWNLTVALLLRGSGKVTDGVDIDSLFTELLSAWKLLFQCRGVDSVTLEAVDDDWHLSTDSKIGPFNYTLTKGRDFTARLAEYHPKMERDSRLGYSAITLFNILKERSRYGIKVSESIREQAGPFFRVLANIVDGANISWFTKNETSLSNAGIPIEYQRMLKEEVSSAPVEGSILSTKETGNQEEELLKRIARAVQEHTHKERLGRLWKQAIQTYTTTDKNSTIPIPIYNAFLSGFLALYAGDSSLEVWNHMIAQGIKPDVTSWTALLSGCGKARDLDGLNMMWDRMTRSGVQPDVYAWTSRIHGLISLRQITAGFAAMDEMGRRWLAAEQAGTTTSASSKKKQVHSVMNSKPPKPTTEVVNGAVSAVMNIKDLSFNRKAEHAEKILQWAGSLSIQPDARTYNILIQLYLRGQDLPTTLRLLKKMEADGLEPDIVTYTMLIRAAFDNEEFYELSPSEQTARVTDTFSRLEAAGLKLNSWIYSSTIDKLLKGHGNMSAVRTIVDHMMTRGMSPTVHIYTSLITHYFQQSPPDIEAVDSLWFQLNERPGSVADRVLFDRIVEGYASVGEIGKMMAVLTKMSALEKLPSWVTLAAVVRALVEAGEWDRARSVVRDVQDGEGVAKGGMRVPTHGMQEFKGIVRKYGLVDADAELHVDANYQDMVEEHGLAEIQPDETNGSVGGIPL